MNDEIRVILIDDESIWLKAITATLTDFGYIVAGTANSFESAAELISSAEYDIALVDISLNEKNKGIELGKLLNRFYNKPFIFITGSVESHTVGEAIEAGPSAYLTKPVHPASLIGTLQSAINNFQNKVAPTGIAQTTGSNFFFVKKGNRYRKIDWVDVVYLRSDKNYTIIYSEADKTEYCIRSTLSKTISYVVPPQLRSSFVQVNRAEAVQVAYMQEVVDGTIKTVAGSFIISETYKADFKKAVSFIV